MKTCFWNPEKTAKLLEFNITYLENKNQIFVFEKLVLKAKDLTNMITEFIKKMDLKKLIKSIRECQNRLVVAVDGLKQTHSHLNVTYVTFI